MAPPNMTPHASQDGHSELRGVYARFALIGFILLASFALTRIPNVDYSLRPIVILCFLALIGNIISLIWIRTGKRIDLRIYAAIFFDALLITIGIHYIGGIESVFSSLYLIAIITVGYLYGIRIGLFSATASLLLYTILLLAEFFGFIPHIELDRLNPVYLRDDLYYLNIKVVSNGVLFYVTAVVSGLLSERLRRAKDNLEQTVADRTKELTNVNEQLREEIAQHKQADKALRESEERYRTLIDSSLAGIYVRGENKLLYVNKRVIDIFGFSLEELQEISIIDLIHPDDKAIAVERAAQRMSGEGPAGYGEYRAITKNGEVKWVVGFGTPIEYQGESAVLGNFIDITDRKQAEEALRESEKRYRLLADNVIDVIWALDLQTLRFTYISPSVESLRGYTVEEAMAQSMEESLTPESYQVAMQALAEQLSPEKMEEAGPTWSVTLELEQTCKDGSTSWVEVTVNFVRGPDGQPVELLGVSREITERRKAETALRESEEKYRSLFEESKDTIYISTPEGKLLDINTAGLEMFGYFSKAEALGVDISKDIYVNPEDRKGLQRAVEKQGFAKDFELSLKKKDGQQIVVLVTVTVERDNNGNVIAYRGVMRDVTEQRLLQQQLFQAQKMESIGTLAGGVAHDFNNILGGILGYASFMKSKMSENDPFFNYVDTIEKSSIRAAELTAQLLAFARGGKYNIRPLDLNKAVQETLKIIGSTIDRSIEIRTELHYELPTVEADAAQMQQVLLNLCVNAADAMPAGGMLTIETTTEALTEEYARRHMGAKPGAYVCLSLSDTGIGMDRETEKRIFEPFFTTKEEGKGTGLGLSMVYGVVKNHGGHIQVYSEPGHGTEFKILLPISGEPEATEAADSEALIGGDELILVIDDEEPIRLLAKDMLESYGYKVLLATDGFEAVEVYTKHKDEVDLVILDMVMPKMGGRETFLELRSVNPKIKALLSTGYSQDGKAQDILDIGVLGFLQKPYQLNEMLSEIRKVLDEDT